MRRRKHSATRKRGGGSVPQHGAARVVYPARKHILLVLNRREDLAGAAVATARLEGRARTPRLPSQAELYKIVMQRDQDI